MDGLLGGLLGGLAGRGGGRGATTALVLGLGAAGVGTLAYLALGSATASSDAATSATAGGDGGAAEAAARRRRANSEDSDGSDGGGGDDASDDDGSNGDSGAGASSVAGGDSSLLGAQLQLATSAFTAAAEAVSAPVVDTARSLSVAQVALLLALCVVLLLLTVAEGTLRAYGVGDVHAASAGRPPSPALWTAVGFGLAAAASALARGAVDPAALVGALVELVAAAAGAAAAALRGRAATSAKAATVTAPAPAPAAAGVAVSPPAVAAVAVPTAPLARRAAAAPPHDAIPAGGIVYDDVTSPGHSLNHRPSAAAVLDGGSSTSSSSGGSGDDGVVFDDQLAAAVGPSGVVVTTPHRRAPAAGRISAATSAAVAAVADDRSQVDARPTLLEPLRATVAADDDAATAPGGASGPLPASPPASSRASAPGSRVSADWSDGSLDALLAGVLSSSAGSTATATTTTGATSSDASSDAGIGHASSPRAPPDAAAEAPPPPPSAANCNSGVDTSVPGDVPLALAERACAHLAAADAALAAADYVRCQASLDAVIAAFDRASVPAAGSLDAVLAPPLQGAPRPLPPLSPPLPPVRTRLLAAALHRRGRLRSLLAPLPAHTPPASKAAVYRAGLDDALRSLGLYEPDADAHKFAGILLARSAADTRERIANGYRIKEHALVSQQACGRAVRARTSGNGEAAIGGSRQPPTRPQLTPPPHCPYPPPPFARLCARSAPRSCARPTRCCSTSWACGATRWRRWGGCSARWRRRSLARRPPAATRRRWRTWAAPTSWRRPPRARGP
jgi:hypothetical protein